MHVESDYNQVVNILRCILLFMQLVFFLFRPSGKDRVEAVFSYQ